MGFLHPARPNSRKRDLRTPGKRPRPCLRPVGWHRSLEGRQHDKRCPWRQPAIVRFRRTFDRKSDSGTNHPLLPDSVRITSKASYNGALVVADFWKFAHGPTVWPAFWGEFIDFVYQRNLMLTLAVISAVGYVLYVHCVRYPKIT